MGFLPPRVPLGLPAPCRGKVGSEAATSDPVQKACSPGVQSSMGRCVHLNQTFLRKNNVTTVVCESFLICKRAPLAPCSLFESDFMGSHLNECNITIIMRSLRGWITRHRQEPQSCCLLFATIKQSPLRFSTHAPTKD